MTPPCCIRFQTPLIRSRRLDAKYCMNIRGRRSRHLLVTLLGVAMLRLRWGLRHSENVRIHAVRD